MRAKRVNYSGEEVSTCQKLTLAQVLPALPPAEHGGAINAVDFLSPHSRDLLLNPNKSILPDDGRELPKLKGIIHAEPGEIRPIADELVKRGICDWIPLESVVKYRGQHVLNGLFGVEKSSRLESGTPVLRLIMNLVGSNSIMRQFAGAVHNLPSITAWMSAFADEQEQIKMWQSDMSNAFYLFRVPDVWKSFLAFNVLREFKVSSGDGDCVMALACKALPMGWLSSVSIMQEISERILSMKQLDPLSQLVRNKAVPQWMVGIFHMARQQSKLWWHVYLDNFALGQVVSSDNDMAAGHSLHDLAETAWSEAGVLSSEKKRKSGVQVAHELGAFIDGNAHYIGGSPERLLRLAHATLWILQQPLLTKKLVQVVAGRWVHVMQFRRPSMAILEKTWEFVGKTTWKQGIHLAVRRELFQCLLAIPLLHTHLGAAVSPVITASDASSVGGAVGLATEITDVGAAYTQACLVNHNSVQQAPIMVISLFGGIGGAFRVYDLLGLQPTALVILTFTNQRIEWFPEDGQTLRFMRMSVPLQGSCFVNF